MENWLDFWAQRVLIGSIESSWQSNTPQGLIRGIRLFSVCINDLDDEMECNLRYIAKKKTDYCIPCSNRDKERRIIDLCEKKRLQFRNIFWSLEKNLSCSKEGRCYSALLII